LILITGLGGVMGPTLAALLMPPIGPNGLFWFLACIHLALGLFALIPLGQRGAEHPLKHTPAVNLPIHSSALTTAQALEDALDVDG
jgi:hypothetical protein